MPSTKPRPAYVLVAVVLLAATLTPSASGAQPKRADLKVTAGHVAVAGARVTGSFTVRNSGTKRAPATSTAVKVDGKRVRSVATRAVRPGGTRVVRFSARVGGGTHVIRVCTDRRHRVAERRERNNCRTLGTVTVESTSVPSDPLIYEAGAPYEVGTWPSEYWVHVPTSYDASHQTPIRLVVFLHGCGGTAFNQLRHITEQVPSASTDFIVMAPGIGRDGQCWDFSADADPLMASIADMKTHFNIDPRRVVLGGYSSGSTLAGQVAFAHAESFAGLMVLPGRPFWSNENRDRLLADAAWKINVAWRPHTSDEYYPIATLRADRRVMRDHAFPLHFSEVAGGHDYTQDDLNHLFDRIGGWAAP